jgi:hypothetical protein
LAIYRGPGGPGDAVNDAASEVLLALQAKDAAVAAQVAAEAAQAAAELAETNAETAETNAETAETNAETAETNAEAAQTAAEAAQAAAEAVLVDPDFVAVAAIEADITTVAGIAADVTTVAGISADVTAVAAVDTDVTTVASDIADVTTVASSIASVNTVAGIDTEVTTVAGIDTEVTTVAGISSDVTTVAGISTDVTDVATIDTDVTTVAGIDTEVTTVAGISANVTTVAGISSNVTTVAGISSDVTTVSGISSDVTAVAADATDIGLVAGSIANVNTVATNIANVNTTATNIANVNTVAGISGNVTTVAGISANVTTVAGISSDVTTVAGDSADIQLLADNIATIAAKANAGANSDITSLSGLTTPLSVGQGGTGANTLTGYVKGAGTTALTASSTIPNTDISGLGTMSTQAASNVAITGGSINGTTVGATTASTGKFTTLEATGVTTVQAGTALLPAITTSGDTNTGIFFPAADTIAFTEGGVESMRIDSSGNVGIGTSSPTYKLVVANAGAQGIEFNIASTTTLNEFLSYNRSTSAFNSLQYRALDHRFFYSNVEAMRIDSSGNVGIGTSSPATKLDIQGGNIRLYDGNVNYGQIEWKRTSDNFNSANIKVAGDGSGYGADMSFETHPNSGSLSSPTEKMRITSTGNVGIGTSSPVSTLDVLATGVATATIRSSSTTGSRDAKLRLNVPSTGGDDPAGQIEFTFGTGYTAAGSIQMTHTNFNMKFFTGTTERMRIDSSGNLLVGTTNTDPADNNVTGTSISATGRISVNQAGSALYVGRNGDGTIVTFFESGDAEGSISVSGNTVSYNAFAGSHWSQLSDGSKPAILRGTVLESINELVEWEGEPTTERLCRVKVSDTAGGKKVYGVFMCWDEDWTATNDMLVTSVGAFICRINKDVVVQEGDLLESNGDGTARVQADDVMRSSTIGKVTCTVKTHEYDDGSYCVPTVLYCG